MAKNSNPNKTMQDLHAHLAKSGINTKLRLTGEQVADLLELAGKAHRSSDLNTRSNGVAQVFDLFKKGASEATAQTATGGSSGILGTVFEEIIRDDDNFVGDRPKTKAIKRMMDLVRTAQP